MIEFWTTRIVGRRAVRRSKCTSRSATSREEGEEREAAEGARRGKASRESTREHRVGE